MKLHYDSYQYSNYLTLVLRVVNNNHVNYCYVVIDQYSNDAILVDPAWEMVTINKVLLANDVSLKGILVTHHHLDHIDLSSVMSLEHDVPVYMSREEVDFYKVKMDKLTTFDGGELLELGGVRIKPIFTPGHTKGSTCYFVGDSLFTGDTLFIETCGFCLDKGASSYDMYNSLTFLKRVVPRRARVFPGHSYSAKPGERFSNVLDINPYLNMDNVEEFVRFRDNTKKKWLQSI